MAGNIFDIKDLQNGDSANGLCTLSVETNSSNNHLLKIGMDREEMKHLGFSLENLQRTLESSCTQSEVLRCEGDEDMLTMLVNTPDMPRLIPFITDFFKMGPVLSENLLTWADDIYRSNRQSAKVTNFTATNQEMVSPFFQIDPNSEAGNKNSLTSLTMRHKSSDNGADHYEVTLKIAQAADSHPIGRLTRDLQNASYIQSATATSDGHDGTIVTIKTTDPKSMLNRQLSTGIRLLGEQRIHCGKWMDRIIEKYETPKNQIDASSHNYPHEGALDDLWVSYNRRSNPGHDYYDVDQKNFEMTLAFHSSPGDTGPSELFAELEKFLKSRDTRKVGLHLLNRTVGNAPPHKITFQTDNPEAIFKALMEDYKIAPGNKLERFSDRIQEARKAQEQVESPEKFGEIIYLPTKDGTPQIGR